jgi:hypothetical protein
VLVTTANQPRFAQLVRIDRLGQAHWVTDLDDYTGGLAVDPSGALAVAQADGCNIFRVVGDAGVLWVGALGARSECGGQGCSPASGKFEDLTSLVLLDAELAVRDNGQTWLISDGGAVTSPATYGSGLAFCDGQLLTVTDWAVFAPSSDGGASVELLAIPRNNLPTDLVEPIFSCSATGVGVFVVKSLFDGGSFGQWMRNEAYRWDPDAGLSSVNIAFSDRARAVIPSAAGSYVLVEGDRVMSLSDAGVLRAIAGGAVHGEVDGPSSVARFRAPQGLARDQAGNVFVADTGNFSIRQIDPSGAVTTLARLADSPRAVAIEDGGSLLVAVPRAVLRIRH